MSDVICTLASVHIYPVKSCAGVELQQGLLTETGLDLDRAWMVVNPRGDQVTQREHPRLALVQCNFKGSDLVLRAPGMLGLHLRLDTVEAATRAKVWEDVVAAFDMGDLAAQWFTDLLEPGLHAPGRGLRLVRFDPEHQRPCDARWTGALQAHTAFADGFPLLVANAASLHVVNQRLVARGAAPVDMRRFRPNLVLQGLPAFEEDRLRTLTLQTDEGEVELQLVKPCSRCSIPDVDPDTATLGSSVGEELARFRVDPRVDGGVSFGVNAVPVRGLDCALRPGQTLRGMASAA